MQSLPFQQPGRFYRGNLHTHSTRSDGGRSPAEVIQTYRDHGYDFLALTDHFLERYGFPIVDTREFRDERFTTLLGAELHAPRTHLGDLWHMVGVGLPLDFAPPAPEETAPALAARAREAGAFVGIAHPGWYGLTLEDALTIDSAHAVEIYNETCATDNDRGESWYISDQLAQLGKRLFAYAADDAHFKTRPDVCKAWVQVRSRSLDPESLLAALKAGHFYSSQGPELHDASVEGGQLTVACSPVSVIYVSGRGSRGASIRGDGLTRAALPIEKFAGDHARVTVVDENGKRAWTNPIWLG